MSTPGDEAPPGETEPTVVDGRDSLPAGSAAEGRRGSIDGRDSLPAGSAAEGRRGSIDDMLGPGTDVGGYHIDGVLGQGGSGFVYAATHPVIGKRAAVKVLKPELSRDPAAVERFAREARAVNQIRHPNIVDIFAFGELPDGRSYYIMDLLAGETLRARLRRTGALHVSEAASVMDETASALTAAHGKGIIHRDLKPDNVFMVSHPGRWPEVKLLDWGLLKLVGGKSKFRTVAGSLMGTPIYMSPEQARASESVDYRTDIYSLGVMAYELLSGTVPFRRDTPIDTLVAHQEDEVPPLAELVPALPDELVQLIEAMLAKEPDGRPTLAAVSAVLQRLKGTKIPTMTAAGLPMPAEISSGRIEVSKIAAYEASMSPATLAGHAHAQHAQHAQHGSRPGIGIVQMSEQLTVPRYEALAYEEPRSQPPASQPAAAAVVSHYPQTLAGTSSQALAAASGHALPIAPIVPSVHTTLPGPGAASSAAAPFPPTYRVAPLGPPSVAPSAPRRRSSRWLVIAAVALFVAAAGVAAILLLT